MAFAKETNWGNLPSENSLPRFLSRRVQKTFRKTAVAKGITDTDYFNEISSYGDAVGIIKR